MTILVKGNIVTGDGIRAGAVVVENGIISEITTKAGRAEKSYDFGEQLILPGFIDIHMHGQADYGIFEVEDIIGIAQNQLQFGTTGFVPTAASLDEEKYHKFASNVHQAQDKNPQSNARIFGAHFEGPFINPLRKGGMDADFLRLPDISETQRYIEAAGDIIKIMTLSPELKGSNSVIQLLKDHGIVASLGHSSATKEDLEKAVEAGLGHICHLFNAFEKKKDNKDSWKWVPGLIEAILVNDTLAVELNCDLQHVLPEHLKLAVKACGDERIVAITDSMQGAGCKPGEYKTTDGREYSTRDRIAKLTSDGTIVGSILTMDKAFANLVNVCGLEIERVAKFTSANPAKVLGVDKKFGTIEPGKYADLAVLDSGFNCVATFVNGEKVYGD